MYELKLALSLFSVVAGTLPKYPENVYIVVYNENAKM